MNIVVAIGAEATPLVQALSLKKDPSCPYTLFTNGSRRLVVSGIGKERCAAATGYLCGRFAQKNQPWLNIGIAGHGTYELGTPFLASRILDDVTGECFYPPQVLRTHIALSELTSCCAPCSKYQAGMGYDMEAHGFCKAACMVTTRELVQIFKIVSDNPDHPLESFDPRVAVHAIEKNLSIIERLICGLEELSREILPDPRIGQIANRIQEKIKFSATRAVQLEDLLRQAIVLEEDLAKIEKKAALLNRASEVLSLIEGMLEGKRSLP